MTKMSTVGTTLNPCRICGGEAHGWVANPNDSTFDGSAGVSCRTCKQEITVEPSQVTVGAVRRETGWEYLFRKLEAARQEAVYRWNAINPKPRVLTSEEQVAANRAWAASFIEEHQLLRTKIPDVFDSQGRVSTYVQLSTYEVRTRNGAYASHRTEELYDQVWVGEYGRWV